MVKKFNFTLTPEQAGLLSSIEHLNLCLKNGTLKSAEMAQFIDMTKKQKEKLVREIYFRGKKATDFYHCADGRIKSYNPQFICSTKDELIDKLYSFYFTKKLENIYEEWVKYRAETKIVSNKTIEEDIGIWNRYIANSQIAQMNISDIKPKHLKKMFDSWTGNGLITKKSFNNRKSVLNGIFEYAVLHELIEHNPLSSLSCKELKFKRITAKKKAYTIEERKKLLAYLDTLEPDAYILAIELAFYGIFRIGEIKALGWNGENNSITIQQQLVEERVLQEDMTLSSPIRVLKEPKGNPNFSIRTEYLPDIGVEILKKMKALNPDGELLFMHQGRPLSTDTFNNRLRKYCNAIGITYLSSHKIRFTGASMLYDAGVKAIDIQPLLGHSTLAMTQHYIEQKVSETDNSQMAKILA